MLIAYTFKMHLSLWMQVFFVSSVSVCLGSRAGHTIYYLYCLLVGKVSEDKAEFPSQYRSPGFFVSSVSVCLGSRAGHTIYYLYCLLVGKVSEDKAEFPSQYRSHLNHVLFLRLGIGKSSGLFFVCKTNDNSPS